MIVILYFMFSVYTSNHLIGSPTKMFDLLAEASVKRPVTGNQDGSYLTLKSNFALSLESSSCVRALGQYFWTKVIGKEPLQADPRPQYEPTSWEVWHGSLSPLDLLQLLDSPRLRSPTILRILRTQTT